MKNESSISALTLEEMKTEIFEAVLKQLHPHLNSLTPKEQVKEYLTRKEVGKMLGVSLPTILDWTNTGKIIGYRIGSRVRYKQSEIEKSLSQIKTK